MGNTPTLTVHLLAENYSTLEHLPSDYTTPIVDELLALRKGFDNVASARADIMSDTSMTEHGRLLALDEMFNRNVTSRVEKVIRAAHAVKMSRGLAAIKRDEVFKPSSDVAEIHLANEIRSRLASLPDADRYSILERAVEAGDKRVVSAVVGSPAGSAPLPAFLSGVDDTVRTGYRDHFIARHHPDIDALHLAAEAASRMADFTLQELAKIRGLMFEPSEEAKLEQIRARRASAARHLN